MPDTNEPEWLADSNARMIETRVCIDDRLGPYDAKLVPANRWHGSVSPFFTLDVVRELAARTQEVAHEYGHDRNDTIHVIDSQREPRALVLHIRWSYLDQDGGSAVSIIQPNDEGLYGIGGWEWTWNFASWQCACGSTMHWHVTDCEGCDPTRDTQPDKTDAAPKEPTVLEDVPPWLADAEAAYATRQEAAAAHKVLTVVDRANRINRELIELGITPIALADVPAGSTALTPALLVQADPEAELYAVYADWDETEGKARLTLGHYWGEYTGQRPGRLLTTIDDVVEARREGPAPQPEPKRPTEIPRQELRKVVERTAAYGPRDGDTGELTALVAGLAAAVLYLADTVTHANDRP
ncbi:hypothetical protein OG426_30640 [Streptomyces canus]|uniref:hypothetical protein n=1 Tax=Streptomyces canus TaxID=58343 RepID=UPI0038649ABB|nr:hypothetical protein OG426_30640 [Streptomyces canus]